MNQKKEEKNIFIETGWEFIERLVHSSLIQESMKVQWEDGKEDVPDATLEEHIQKQILEKIEE